MTAAAQSLTCLLGWGRGKWQCPTPRALPTIKLRTLYFAAQHSSLRALHKDRACGSTPRDKGSSSWQPKHRPVPAWALAQSFIVWPDGQDGVGRGQWLPPKAPTNAACCRPAAATARRAQSMSGRCCCIVSPGMVARNGAATVGAKEGGRGEGDAGRGRSRCHPNMFRSLEPRYVAD